MRRDRTYRLRSARRAGRIVPLILATLLLPPSLAAQDVYLTEWTIQDPENDLLQDVASRTIDAINHWLTRDNVEAQTVRLDDPLRITVIGRYQAPGGTIREELLRVRAGAVLIEDDPRLYLTEALIDSLLKRNYLWSQEQVELLDPARAPGYLQRRSTGISLGTASPAQRGPAPPGKPAETMPLLALDFPDGHRAFADLGYPGIGLGGLLYGRVRLGFGRDQGAIWAELPARPGLPGSLSTALRGTGGIGGMVRIDWATLLGSLGFASAPDQTGRPDTVRLITALRVFGTITPRSPLFGNEFFCIDIGGGATELGYRSATVNGVPSERTALQIYPLAGIRIYPGSGGEQNLVQLLSLHATHRQIESSVRFRLNDQIGLQIGAVLSELSGADTPWRDQATFWITPLFKLHL